MNKVWWLLAGFVLLCALYAGNVKAENEIYLGAWSKHFVEGEYNEVHNMVGINYDSWVVAYFKNSYNRHTGLLGKDWRWHYKDLHYGVIGGLTYGYRECYGDNGRKARACLFLAPYLGYDAKFAPKFVATHQMGAIIGTYQF